MARHRLLVAYDGTDFHGWQKQHQPSDLPGRPSVMPGAEAGVTPDGRPRRALRTVQQVLEDAVCKVIMQRVPVGGGSRTDSGVHARAQTAAFTAPDDRLGPPVERMAQAINARLPDDALVLECAEAPDDFDPIADCLAKGYRYTLWSSYERPLWARRYVAHVHAGLDAAAMDGAARVLIGEHDFAAFASAGHGRESTVRTVTACSVARLDERRIAIDISANGFLYNMVRIVAGTLVDVGRGRKGPADVRAALASGDRSATGQTMPPQGLCLMWGAYPSPVGVVGDGAPSAQRAASRPTGPRQP